MGLWGNFVNGISAGVGAFREQMLNADPVPGIAHYGTAGYFDEYGRWEARRLRYDLNWALYQNNAYSEVMHPFWAATFKGNRGAYKHIRNLFSPCSRLGEFWAERTQGGSLDHNAGDGEGIQSALPILTKQEGLRPAIAQLWKDCRWQVNKNLFCRFGAVLGDVGLMIRDHPDLGMVTMEVIHPGTITWVQENVRTKEITGYVREERRYDPREPGIAQSIDPVGDGRKFHPTVTYTEQCFKTGDDTIHFRTFLNGELWDWDGFGVKWDVDMPFVPLVLAQHESFGQPWGISCFHSGISRAVEVDDQASGLSDQIRKAIRAPHLLSGVANPALRNLAGTQVTTGGAMPGWPSSFAVDEFSGASGVDYSDTDQTAYLYGPKDAKATSLVFNLDIAGVTGHIAHLMSDIDKNFPELLSEAGAHSGDTSGRALKEARKRTTSKVQSIRPNYDDPFVRAMQMAIALGGQRNYDGYKGFSFGSLKSGALDMRIGHRPVFDIDPIDELDEEKAFLENVNLAVQAGIPLEVYLKRQGWSSEEIAELTRAKEEAMNKAQALVGTQGDIRPPLAGDLPKPPPLAGSETKARMDAQKKSQPVGGN